MAPPPANAQRVLLDSLRAICGARALTLVEHCDGWVLTLERGARRTHVFGYDFALNTATAQLIAKDKAATSALLLSAGVPAIPHELHHHPGMAAYVSAAGSWRALGDSFERYGRDVVCKRNEGTGGADVLRVRSERELSAAVQQLFARTRSLCISPFVPITREVRVLVLRGRPLLVYEKLRPAVVGDGERTVLDLALARVQQAPSPADEAALVLAALAAEVDPRAVPAIGEEIVLNFRHNLGQGSTPRDLRAHDPSTAAGVALAARAADAIGISLASVDLVEDLGGNLAVLEINSGIMMESYARVAQDGRRVAVRVYDAIVCDALGITSDEASPP